MRAVVQRVTRAACRVDNKVTGEIGPGLIVFLGIAQEDEPEDVNWLARKIAALRIFEDDDGKMNCSLTDIAGGALVISQFTLFGNVKKGARPSFNRSAAPELATQFYEDFKAALAQILGCEVACGMFAEDMQIEAHNDGPVTLVIDSRQRDF